MAYRGQSDPGASRSPLDNVLQNHAQRIRSLESQVAQLLVTVNAQAAEIAALKADQA